MNDLRTVTTTTRKHSVKVTAAEILLALALDGNDAEITLYAGAGETIYLEEVSITWTETETHDTEND